ncbi:MAG: hypothetical protein D6689_01420 [Deltaproteobacteria bacterium]|nr:MAG: hypothetical protein D6689_01420 [Deltaproteobacteria bacterium]
MTPSRDAAVHDLSYRPYEGVRRPLHTRYRAIARNLVAVSWRGWLRLRAWVIAAVIAVVVFGALTYVFSFLTQNRIVEHALAGSGTPLRLTDYLLPLSVDVMTTLAFVVGLTALAGAVADDLRAGAFEFYFARPIRARDYIAGKLLGGAIMIGAIALCGPVVVALVQLALSTDTARAAAGVARAIAAGAIATAAFAVVPLGIGALGSRRRYTAAAWALLYLVAGNVAIGIGHAVGAPEVGALSLKQSVMALAYAIFDVRIVRGDDLLPPEWAAVLALIGYVGAALGALSWRVRRAYRRGVATG